jgi:transposase-like protein
MEMPNERRELIRAVRERGETVVSAAARLRVPAPTAYRWVRLAAKAAAPTFVEVVAERDTHSTIRVRVGVAEIEVRAGFDARLLRAVVEALGDVS